MAYIRKMADTDIKDKKIPNPQKEPVSPEGSIPKILFLTGFLGSGKTTLLNNLLSMFSDKKIGVIVNSFGTSHIDASVPEKCDNSSIKERNGGTLFYSCISGTLVQTILQYQDLPIEYLFVETPGMMEPETTRNIISEIEKQAEKTFEYLGTIGVVDAKTFLPLVGAVRTVYNQVAYSDMILINKIDTVDEETLIEIRKKMKTINQHANSETTMFGKIHKNVMKKLSHRSVPFKDQQKRISDTESDQSLPHIEGVEISCPLPKVSRSRENHFA